jgi:hypothetical protein
MDFSVDFMVTVPEHGHMQIQQRHEWKEETEEGIRLYRGIYHSKKWKFTTAMKGTRSNPPEWVSIEEVTDAHWEALRDVLYRKYQRKRLPWKLVESIDKILGKDAEPD